MSCDSLLLVESPLTRALSYFLLKSARIGSVSDDRRSLTDAPGVLASCFKSGAKQQEQHPLNVDGGVLRVCGSDAPS